MSQRQKIVAGVAVFSLAVLVLLSAAIIILPRLIDSETLKAKIRNEFYRRTGGTIDFNRVDLSFSPRPRLEFNQAAVVLPQSLSWSAETVILVPEILPLLYGKIGIREIQIRQTDADLPLRTILGSEKLPHESMPPFELVQRAIAGITALPEVPLPVLTVSVASGRLRLTDGNRTVFELHDIDVTWASSGRIANIQARGASAAAESVFISGWLDDRNSSGAAHIQLSGLRPQVLGDVFFPDSLLKIQSAPAGLSLDVNLNGTGRIQADFDISLPELTLSGTDDIVAIRGGKIKSRIELGPNSAAISLAELVLDHPRMTVSGRLVSALDDEPVRLELEGRDIDVKETRRAALDIAGENEVIRGIFDVLKGGTVPLVTVTTRGKALSELGDMDALVIRGQMRDGDITIPGVQLNLSEVAGEAVISHGILEGDNLRARLGGSSGKNGTLKLGLVGDEVPFHLEVDVRAELSQLPPILERLVGDKDFRRELAKLEDLKGTANGKLVLGEDLNNVNVTVAASGINLTARYRGIPHPVAISDGNFSYTAAGIGIGQLRGALGKSTFSDLSGALKWRKKSELEISSARCNLYLAEMVSWLASFDALREWLPYFGGGKGSIAISALKLKGPLQVPRAWQFNVAGEVRDLVLENLPELPGKLKIAFAKFKADPKTFAYTNTQFDMKDASLELSGTHRGYLKEFNRDVSLTLEGRLGPEFTGWLAHVLGAPTWLKFKPQTLLRSKLRFAMGDPNSFSASISTQEGLEISTDILVGGEELIIDKLLVQDPVSRADLGLRVKGDAVDFAFDGKIYQQTFNRLFRAETVLAGSIDGKMRSQWDLRNLSRSKMEGELRGSNIFAPYDPATPLKINSFAIHGDASRIRIDTADLNWSEMRLTLSGTIQPESVNRLSLDMSIAADAVDLDHLIQMLKSGTEKKEPRADHHSPFPALTGNIRFETDRLIFSGLTWRPLHADVSLQSEKIDITLKEALLCGISTPGTISLRPGNMRFDISTLAQNQELNPALNCFAAARSTADKRVILVGKDFKADGVYSLKGSFRGNGKAQDLLKTATGEVVYSAADGHIYQDFLLLNVLKYLNTTELLLGQTDLKKMEKAGFGYRTMNIEARLQKGKMSYDRIILDGASLALTAVGKLDFLTGKLDFNVLVTPQVTLNSIFDKIPLIGGILQTFNTIPLGLKGTLDDIRIVPLAPSAVAHELVSLMKKTARGPIKLIQIGKKP
ncbi:MAG: AsmA-like C-terminal region-containing protein [Desulfobacterales bacterium]